MNSTVVCSSTAANFPIICRCIWNTCAVAAEKRSVRFTGYRADLALLSARLQQRDSRYAVLFDLLLKLANTVNDSDKVAENCE